MHFVVSIWRHPSNIRRTLYKCVDSINRCRLPNSDSTVGSEFRVRWYSSDAVPANTKYNIRNKSDFFEFHHEWPTDVKTDFLRHMIVIENFVSEIEEAALCAEVQKSMRRMRYQYDHWDDAIHGYREMEKGDWAPDNEPVIQRMRTIAFDANVLPHVHCLDLAADGIIKPHVDSSRYCGSTIAGLSLLTDCIMRLKRVDESKYRQNRFEDDHADGTEQPEQYDESSRRSNRENSKTTANAPNEVNNYFVDILLKRHSLYIMRDSARYNFSHEVLASKSIFGGKEIAKERRISIICRNQP